MRRARERRLDAYRDGELSPGARHSVERSLARDPEAARRVDDTERLGRAIRAAWSEGPPVPSPDYLIAALRPELRRIDRELAEVGALSRLLGRLRQGLQPAPAGAFAAACALALFLFLALPSLLPSDLAAPTPSIVAQAPTGSVAGSEAFAPIYDLAQSDQPLMILQGADGSTVIWVLNDPEPLSALPGADGWA